MTASLSQPWLSVVIPTIGRPELTSTLDALDAQPADLLDGVEVLVVGDTYGGRSVQLDNVREHLETERPAGRYRCLDYDGGLHCYGQPQRNYGAREALGEWVWFGQDDNVATADALHFIRAATRDANAPGLFIFRVLCWWRHIVWRDPVLRESNLDADGLVMRRDVAQRANFGMRYEGDYDAAAEAARLSEVVGWGDEIVSIARPEKEHRWWTDHDR